MSSRFCLRVIGNAANEILQQRKIRNIKDLSFLAALLVFNTL